MKAGLSTQERKILDRIVADEKIVVQTEDVSDIAKVDRSSSNAILSRLSRKGWLQRVMRGKYVVVRVGAATDSPADEYAWQVASEIYAPCIISGWSAAEHWGLTDQIFNAVSLVTASPQRSRDQIIGGIRFRTRTLPAGKLFGARNVWFGSTKASVADPHRTLIDICDAPDFGGGGRHMADIARQYWIGRHTDERKILEYAERFGRGTVYKRLGVMAETYGDPSDEWIRRCKVGCSRGISLLDPRGPNKGPIKSRWGIRINVPMEFE